MEEETEAQEVKPEFKNSNASRGQAGDTSEKAKGHKTGCGDLVTQEAN